jgi:NADH-quinone oxidoreductase subunit L
VGVSSFLLIGFYYNKPSAVAAAKKAFIVTRFADLGFLIGILVLSYYSNTLDFNTLIANLTSPGSNELTNATASTFLGISGLTWGLTLIFIGGAGKSAMFPLHIWLPDAMEGPTPVSALIHAATMVVAGVFLVARLFPVFAICAPSALEIVAWTGAVSAIFAAIIACTQTDIKRVLAYSTMSQIGFMMFALGVSKYSGEGGLGFTASMFHLFTHAMFKALLFLGAGAVIHYVHSNELKDMGGLRKKLPVTHITFLIGCLAIAGVPPLAGFFSKEEILLAAYENNQMIFLIALITSGLTAFYMFRLYFGIFWNKEAPSPSEFPGKTKGSSEVRGDEAHHGEGGITMMLPLILLSMGAAVSGFIPFGKYVSSDGTPLETKFHLQFSIAPVVLGLTGIFTAMWLYTKQNNRPDRVAASLSSLYKTAYNKFYIDELYLFVTKKVLFNLIGRPAAWFDKNVVDGLFNLTGNTTQLIAEKIKKIQSGKVQQYAIYFLVGVIGLALLFIYLWK